MRSGSMQCSPWSAARLVVGVSSSTWSCALALIAASCATHVPEEPAQPTLKIAWEPWSDAAFARAHAEHKLVLLDLQAVWCHWCHVMEETTYADPDVRG